MPIPEIKLSPENKQRLLDLDEDIKALKREFAKAKSAGFDVAEMEKEFNDALRKREGALRVYG